MRWLIAAGVALALLAGPARAATPLELACGAFAPKWSAVRRTGNVSSMEAAYASIPAYCPLKRTAAGDLDRARRAARAGAVAEARPAKPSRPEAQRPARPERAAQADTPRPAPDDEVAGITFLDRLQSRIEDDPKAAEPERKAAAGPAPSPVMAEIDRPAPAAAAAGAGQEVALLTVHGPGGRTFPAMAPGVLPPLPDYQAPERFSIPQTFCSVEARIAFIETVTTPAYMTARRNVEQAVAYLDWLNALSAAYKSTGSGHQIPVVKAFNAFQPTLAELQAASSEYRRLDNEARAVPVVACAVAGGG